MSKTSIEDLRFAIYINNDKAVKSIIELDTATGKLEASLQKLVAEGKHETAEYKAKKDALQQVILEKKKLDDTSKALAKEMQKLIAAGKEEGAEFKKLKTQNDANIAAKAKLTTQTKELNAAMDKLRAEGKAETAEFKALTAAINNNKEKQQALRKEAGLSALSIKELKSLYAQLRKEFNAAIPGSDKRARLEKELQIVDTRLNHLTGRANTTGMSFGKMADGFNKYFGMFTAFAATFTGVVLGIRKAIDEYNKFEQSLANLSALTGLAGTDLKWLGEQAKQLSIGTTESGIKITKSSTDILEAYKLMGSAKPELLKNKEALAEVTEKALILAEAASMETAPAVEALASIMNQFGAGADQSSKYINILAAGSKEGAAEVGDLSDAIIRSGAAATQANITIEQEVALIEALAEKGIKAERAGTGLRGMILKMQKGADEFNPKVVGLNQALENLAAKNLSAKGMMELFGEESYTVAQTLITSRARVEDLTTAVTDTNVAFEQANINTSTNGAKLEQAKNKAQLYAIELGERLAPAMTFSTNILGKFLKLLSEAIKFYTEHARLINAVVIGIIAFTVAVKAADMWSRIYENGIKKVIDAVKGLNTTMSKNIWGLVAAGIATAVTYLMQYKSTAEKLKDVEKDLNARLAKSSAEFNTLKEALLQSNMGSQRRKELIDQMNSQYGEYLKNQISEKDNTEDIAAALVGVNDQLMKKEIINMKDEKTTELQTEIIKSQLEAERLLRENNEKEKFTIAQLAQFKRNVAENEWTEQMAKNQADGVKKGLKMQVDKNNREIAEEKRKQIELKQQLLEQNKIFDAVAAQYKSDINNKIGSPKEGDIKDGMIFKNGKWISIDGGDPDAAKKAAELRKKENQDFQEWLDKMREEDLQKEADYQKSLLDLALSRLEDAKKAAYKKEEDEDKQRMEILDRMRAEGDNKFEFEINTLKLQYEEKLKLFEQNEEAYVFLTKERDAKIKEIEEKALDERMKKMIEEFDGIVNLAQSTLSAYSKINSAINKKNDLKLQHSKENNEKEKEDLQKLYDSGRISKEQYDKKVLALDKKFDTETKQMQNAQAKREQQMAIFEQSIATAVAIANAVKLAFSRSATVWDAIAGAAIAVGEVVALMVTAGSYQKKAPEFASGNLAEVIGAQTGKSYKNVPVESHAGNRIYTKPTLVGGKLVGDKGRELVLNQKTTDNLFMNYPVITRAIQMAYVPQFATGNLQNIASQYQTNSNNAGIDMSSMEALLMELIIESRKPKKSYVVYKELKDTETIVNKIEKSVSK